MMKQLIRHFFAAGLVAAAIIFCGPAQDAFAAVEEAPEAKTEETPKEQIALAAPTITQLESVSGSQISIAWTAVDGADFYRVYRSSTQTGGYKRVKTVYGTSLQSAAALGETYYYKVKALRRNSDGKAVSGPCSEPQMVKVSLEAPVISSVSTGENNSLTIAWNGVEQADGYAVYRRTAEDKSYTNVKYTKKLTWKDATVEAGIKYYYKVRAYKTISEKKNYSKYSASKAKWTASDAPGDVVATQDGSGTVTLQWTASRAASSYRIFRATGENGTYEKIATGIKTCSYTDASLVMGETYSYQIVAIHGSLISVPCPEVDVRIGKITVSTRTLFLGMGESWTLTAESELEGTFGWSSADPSVAAVEEDGTVTGVAQGTTQIFVSLDGVTAGIDVTVTDTELNGIDVSKWQQAIDWKTVKASGIKFAMLRLAHGTSKDIQFESYYADAKKQKIPVGIYCYTLAKSVDEGIEEANTLLELLDGKELDYPIALDLESDNQIKNMSKAERTELILEYKQIVEEAGYQFVVYANLNWLNNYIDQTKLEENNVDIWIARYRSQSLGYGYEGGGNVRMWQYSSTGKVDGILDAYGRYINVDLDVCYDGY